MHLDNERLGLELLVRWVKTAFSMICQIYRQTLLRVNMILITDIAE